MKAKKISWVHEYDEKRRINRIRFRIKQEKREKKAAFTLLFVNNSQKV